MHHTPGRFEELTHLPSVGSPMGSPSARSFFRQGSRARMNSIESRRGSNVSSVSVTGWSPTRSSPHGDLTRSQSNMKLEESGQGKSGSVPSRSWPVPGSLVALTVRRRYILHYLREPSERANLRFQMKHPNEKAEAAKRLKQTNPVAATAEKARQLSLADRMRSGARSASPTESRQTLSRRRAPNRQGGGEEGLEETADIDVGSPSHADASQRLDASDGESVDSDDNGESFAASCIRAAKSNVDTTIPMASPRSAVVDLAIDDIGAETATEGQAANTHADDDHEEPPSTDDWGRPWHNKTTQDKADELLDKALFKAAQLGMS
mmetsp:Transcript_41702/g.98068  ORF Transcript_41702/g.98068 Transcript_41702/m.98068 type:complete len:322 (-) Transcript_41702:50-1015(-)